MAHMLIKALFITSFDCFAAMSSLDRWSRFDSRKEEFLALPYFSLFIFLGIFLLFESSHLPFFLVLFANCSFESVSIVFPFL